jgi:hypothetical protein
MKLEKFKNLYGVEEQKVTKNFSAKALGVNYDIKDAFIEFCDNAYDARLSDAELNFVISVNNDEHTLSFEDNGMGIDDDDNLFTLGGTNKESDNDKIGKYGIGVPGAVSAIAKQCVYDKNNEVEITFESSSNGTHFEKHILILPNANWDMYIGKSIYNDCDYNHHFTKITFSNVDIKSLGSISLSMEEVFENPIHNNLNIIINGRTLGKSSSSIKTFNGDEGVETVKVRGLNVDVKFRIISGGAKGDDVRKLEEAGLRVYDKSSGRLLAKSEKLWRWYCGKKPQQTICGLRAAIYIESSIESYNIFGIASAKNGVTFKDYYKKDEFKELKNKLCEIYQRAAGGVKSNETEPIKVGHRVYIPTNAKLGGVPYHIVGSEVFMKKKYSTEDVATLIDRVISLEEYKSKKELKKSKKVKEFEE